MKFVGLEPIAINDPAIEIHRGEQWWDLHNAASLRRVALENAADRAKPADLVLDFAALDLRNDFRDTGVRYELRFVAVTQLAFTEYEDNVYEQDTLEHLLFWPERVQVRTGTHEIEFEAAETHFTVR